MLPSKRYRLRPGKQAELPKMMLGTVCVEWKRCGRPTCRCAQGNLHGPYYYLHWGENGRKYKEYIRLADVSEVRQRCEARRRYQREAAWMRQELRELSTLIARMEQP